LTLDVIYRCDSVIYCFAVSHAPHRMLVSTADVENDEDKDVTV